MPLLLALSLALPTCADSERPSGNWLPQVLLSAVSSRATPASRRGRSSMRHGQLGLRSVHSLLVSLRWARRPRRSTADVARACTLALALVPATAAAQSAERGAELSLTSVLDAVLDAHAPDETAVTRARRSGWAPALVRVEARWEQGRRADEETRITQDYDEELLPDATDVRDTSSLWDDNARTFRVQLAWDLRDVVYHADEPRLAANRRSELAHVVELLERATEAWLGWTEAERMLTASDPVERASAQWRMELHGATLRLLTDGRIDPSARRVDTLILLP